MTIDANELREAIAYLRCVLSEFAERGTHRIATERVIAGAELGLATLPREVEVEGWAVVDGNGNRRSIHFRQEQAERFMNAPGDQVTRLSGLVTLPPRGKD